MPSPGQFPDEHPTAAIQRRLAALERAGRRFGKVGAGTILNAATTSAVTHGLGATPSSVIVTSRGNELIWVGTVNSTSFVATRTGSSGALGFFWRVDR